MQSIVPFVSHIDGSKALRNHLKRFFLKGCLVLARELSSFVGKIISTGAVFGKISRIMTRYCSITVASAQDWDSKFHLDQYCVRELGFWRDNLARMNVKVVAGCPSKVSNYVVYSDASATGCGAHLDVNGEQVCQVCHKQWDKDECGKSSKWRELSAILFALQSFLPLLKGSYVKWFSDSQNACKTENKKLKFLL